VVYLDDGEIAVVRPGEYRILDLDAVEKYFISQAGPVAPPAQNRLTRLL